MKHSRETRGFSKDSLLPIMPPEPPAPHSTISCSIFLFPPPPPTPPPNLQPSTAPHPTNRSGDEDLPFALTANTPLLCPPTVGFATGGDTDLLPDLSPESRHSAFRRLFGAIDASLAEHILLQLPPTPSLRLIGDGDDLPLRHPTAAILEPVILSLFSRISPEELDLFRLNFTRSDAGIGRSSPAATSVTDVEIEKPSLTLQTSEVSSDLSSLTISLPPSLPISTSSSLGGRGAFNFGVSDRTSFTVSSSAASASGGGSRQPPANPDG